MKTNSAHKYILPFLVPTLVLALVLGIALLIIPKAELHLALCQPHTTILDTIVPIITNLVDWLPYLCVVLLLFYRAGWATFLASNLLLSTLIVQPIKHIIHAPRPLTWFAENMPDISLPLVEGVKMNHWLSFPSGHTTLAFTGAAYTSYVFSKYNPSSSWKWPVIISSYAFVFWALLLVSSGTTRQPLAPQVPSLQLGRLY